MRVGHHWLPAQPHPKAAPSCRNAAPEKKLRRGCASAKESAKLAPEACGLNLIHRRLHLYHLRKNRSVGSGNGRLEFAKRILGGSPSSGRPGSCGEMNSSTLLVMPDYCRRGAAGRKT